MKAILSILLITSMISVIAWSLYRVDVRHSKLEADNPTDTDSSEIRKGTRNKTFDPIPERLRALVARHDQYATKHQIVQHEVVETDDYYHYEYRTLWNLAEQADRKAISYLRERLDRFEEEAREDFFDGLTDQAELDHLDNEQIDLAYLDLIAGNPMAVFRIAWRTSEGDTNSKDEYEQYTYFRHFATWSEIGVSMGSNLALYQGMSALNSMAERNPLKFTKSELEYLSEDAMRMLNELEQQRMDLGWGPFPNAKERRENYNVLLKEDVAKMQSLTNWGTQYQ